MAGPVGECQGECRPARLARRNSKVSADPAMAVGVAKNRSCPVTTDAPDESRAAAEGREREGEVRRIPAREMEKSVDVGLPVPEARSYWRSDDVQDRVPDRERIELVCGHAPAFPKDY